MKEKPRFLRSLEHFFWVFLFINPFLDILNGVYLNLIQRVGVLDVENAVIGITPTLVLRMLLLVVFAVYVLCGRDRRDILTAAGIAAALVLSMISEYRFTGKLGYFVDLQYMARFAFNIVLFMVYSRVLAGRGWSREELLARLDRLIRYTLFVLTVSILVSSVLGLGYRPMQTAWAIAAPAASSMPATTSRPFWCCCFRRPWQAICSGTGSCAASGRISAISPPSQRPSTR